MKAAGAVCILTGAAYGRWIAQREWKRRRKALESLRLALFRMEEEIRIGRIPLPCLLNRLASECGETATGFFSAILGGYREGKALDTVWKEACEALPLSEPDCRTLRDLAGELRGDAARIEAALHRAAECLEESGARMDAACRDTSRQITALFFSGAALLVILLY